MQFVIVLIIIEFVCPRCRRYRQVTSHGGDSVVIHKIETPEPGRQEAEHADDQDFPAHGCGTPRACKANDLI